MKKALLTLAILGLIASPSAFAAEHRGASAPTPTVSGNTTEVRYVSVPSNRRGAKVSKLVITRDATGRIISVKRG